VEADNLHQSQERNLIQTPVQAQTIPPPNSNPLTAVYVHFGKGLFDKELGNINWV
jgi:hypothetical protein